MCYFSLREHDRITVSTGEATQMENNIVIIINKQKL